MEEILKIKNINKKFNDKIIFDNISFSINKGEVVSLIGPSGAGKTTLLRCINFLEKADSGQIIFENNEYDFNSISRKQIYSIRLKTSFVFQNYNLFLNKTALENVIEGLIVARKIDKNTAIKKGKEMLDKVGLSDKYNSYSMKLSGGEQQRVAIARALATNPKIIYFDEPTSALDPELTNEVLLVMNKLAKEGITMLVVTHEISFAKNVSTRVMFMENGKILEDRPSNEFFDNPKEERTKEFLKILNTNYKE